jgi:hypothetical protein
MKELCLMMPQMEPGESARERSGSGYGAYAGNAEYAQPQYRAPYEQPSAGGAYDDNFIEALAQRIAQRSAQGPSGKVYSQSHRNDQLSAGQRLALAIVSVVMLIPIAGICVGGMGGFGGLMGFVVGCVAIVLINAVFNMSFKS